MGAGIIPNISVFRRKLADFPIATYQAGETVVAAGSTTGRLLILRKGVVAVLKEGVEIATVTEPGAVFFSISPTWRMYVRWRSRSFTPPMRPHYSGWTRSRSFTLQQSWHGVWTTPLRR